MELTETNRAEIMEDTKTEDIKVTNSEQDVVFFLDKDVYNFYLLIRKTKDYSKLSCVRRFKIKFLVFLCAFAQVGSMITLLLVSDELNYDRKEASVNCAINNINDTCTIVENKFNYIYGNRMSFFNYMIRILSLTLIMTYMYPMTVAIPLYSVKFLHTRSVSWIAISIFQAFILFVVSWRINELVYKSTSYIDIFSNGIGFIILLEVDAVIYNAAYSAKYYAIEQDLFQIRLTKSDLQNTIFSKFHHDTYDLLTFSVCLVGYLFSACLACGWYSLGYEHDEGLLLYNTLILIPSLGFLFLLVVWPFFFVFRAVYYR